MDDSSKRLVKGSYYLLLSNVITSIGGALFWVILAKIVDASDIGQAMIVITFVTIIITVAANGIERALAKYIAEFNTQGRYAAVRKVIKLGLILSLIISISAAVVIFLLSDYISIIYSNNVGLALLITFASFSYIPSQTLVLVLTSIYTAYHKAQYVLITTIIFQALRFTIAIILALYQFNAFAIVAGFSIAAMINAIISFIIMQGLPKQKERKAKEIENKMESVDIKSILTFSGFNYIASFMRVLRNQIGILTIGVYSIEAAAFYGISNLIAAVVGNIMLSITNMLLPILTEEITNNNKENVKRLFNLAIRLALVFNGFIILFIIVEPSYVLRLISSSYIEASDALRILVIAHIINATSNLMGSLLNAINRAKDIAIRESIAAMIIILLTPVLASVLSMEGVALALLIGSIVNLILSYYLIKRQGFTISASIYKVISSVIVSFTIAYILIIAYHNTLISLILALLIHAGFSLAVKSITIKEISSLFSIIKGR